MNSPEIESLWSLSKSGPQGVVVFVPGLNTAKKAMAPFTALLNSAGFHVLHVSLRGHSPKEGGVCDGDLLSWQEDIEAAVTIALARYPHLPLSYAGYSLGGPLLLTAIDRGSIPSPERLILVAPALSLRSSSWLLWPFTGLRVFGARLPSLAPPEIRAQSATSLRSYKGLYDAVSEATSPIKPKKIASIPTLSLLNTSDKLIDSTGVSRWVEKLNSPIWRVVSLTAHPALEGTRGHFLLSELGVGKESWDTITGEVREFLQR